MATLDSPRELIRQKVAIANLKQNTIDIVSGDGLKDGGTVKLGNSVSLNIKPSDFAGSGLQDSGSQDLELTNNSVTVSTGNGLKGGSSIALGGSNTISADVLDLAGSGLQDDGTSSLELVNNSITLNAGDGLKNGSTASLGSSFSLDVEPSDFTGNFLDTSGAPPDIDVQIGSGLQGDGAGNIIPKTDSSLSLSSGNLGINTSNSNSFSASQTFSSGIEVNANITDGTTTVYDSSNSIVPGTVIPDSLSFTKVSVDTLSNNNNARIDFEVGSTKRGELDNSGNLSIEGSLTEGATL
jgi:hypothetical protein